MAKLLHTRQDTVQLQLIVLVIVTSLLLHNSNIIFQLIVACISLFCAFKISQLAGLNREDLGISRQHFRSGLLWGTCAVGVCIAGVYLASIVVPDTIKDPRYNQSILQAIKSIVIVLPIKTVLLEEFIFRGVVYGFYAKQNNARGYVISSVLFGFWHIVPSLGIAAFTLPMLNILLPHYIGILGIVVVTSVAGLIFTWLRAKSGSLIAPIMAHFTINASAIIAASLLWQR